MLSAKEVSPTDTVKEESNTVQSELADLEARNKLAAEKLTEETARMRAEITRLKVERELITERLAIEAAKRDEAIKDAVSEAALRVAELTRESEIARVQSEKYAAELKAMQSKSAIDLMKLQSEIDTIKMEDKRASFADSDPVYLKNPLRDDGVLVISDRRIPLNGLIGPKTADHVTSRIDFWNNRDKELPIFIVIDDCPGGSVMAGYRILRSMETSEAPVYVVVKSFAASMAACIATLAEESYAYPNAVILHHQISSQIIMARLNLTQQKEFYQESQKWWGRLATPVAEKMGITTEEFIKQMYSRSTSGDWTEFGDRAKELKWVNHIVDGMVESSINVNPDAAEAENAKKEAHSEEVDEDGNVFMSLPRLNPKDVYFLYNPDGYYRMK